MLKPIAAAMVVLLPLTAHAADSQSRYAVKGAGRANYSLYVKAADEQSKLYPQFVGWLEGYFSAINQFTPDTYDIAPFVDLNVLVNLILSNCRKNPQVNLAQMAQAATKSVSAQRLHEASPLIEARVGERKQMVYRETLRRVQRELAEAGYFEGDINGLFGEDSVKALEAFQADRSLTVTGVPDAPTLVTIFSDIAASQPSE